MTITDEIREQVRRRADFACEFCGVTETDTGGELTVDHFQPKAKGGADSLDNLLYCCARCNQYKLDYWPMHADDPALWNPRREPASLHFLELDDGTLQPLTTTGAFTLKRLRLNPPASCGLPPTQKATSRRNSLADSLSRFAAVAWTTEQPTVCPDGRTATTSRRTT